jgi:hypothetical protein
MFIKIMLKHLTIASLLVIVPLTVLLSNTARAQSPSPTAFPPQSQSEGIGLTGTVSTPPPSQAATIVSPSNGAVYRTLPITVSGWCPADLLVKMFKNNVFSGSAMCQSNSYSIQIDLFSDRNDLVARVYDSFDQAGPDSNTVTVTFDDSTARPEIAARISLTSNYARRGANPGELLTWPIVVSGGQAPYAISVDWNDSTSADVYTATTPGELTIKHQYGQSGVYRVLIKASDTNGAIAYLQLVAIGNGEVTQSVAGASSDTKTATKGKTVIMWQPAAIAIPLVVSTFWFGKKYEMVRVKRRLMRGEHPFGY